MISCDAIIFIIIAIFYASHNLLVLLQNFFIYRYFIDPSLWPLLLPENLSDKTQSNLTNFATSRALLLSKTVRVQCEIVSETVYVLAGYLYFIFWLAGIARSCENCAKAVSIWENRLGIISFLDVGHAWFFLWTKWKVEQNAIKNLMWE